MTHTMFRLNKRWTIEPAGRRWCLARRRHPGAVPGFSLYADKPEELAVFAQQYVGGVDQKILGRLRQEPTTRRVVRAGGGDTGSIRPPDRRRASERRSPGPRRSPSSG